MYEKWSIAKQYINEKLNSTKREIVYEEDFIELKKKFEAMAKFFETFEKKIIEIAHPDSQWRLTHKLYDQFDKMAKAQTPREDKYPQVEKSISFISLQCGSQVGGLYGQSLIDISSGFDRISDMKDKLEMDLKLFVSTNQVINSEISHISSCKKKLSSKRLKLEALKNKKSTNPTELYKIAEEYNALNLECYNAYLNFVEIEQDAKIEQMVLLAQSLEDFYSDCHKTMKTMVETLKQRYKVSLSIEKPKLKSMAESEFEDKIKSLIERCQSNHSPNPNLNPQKILEEPQNPQNSSVIYDVMTVPVDIDSNNMIGGKNLSTNLASQQKKLNASSQKNPLKINDSFETEAFNSDLPKDTNNEQKPIMFEAIFNFQAEDKEELDFKIGDVISYISDLDENWYFGEFNNKKGIFPKEYVKRI